MLGGLAALPAQAAGGATATARQYALMARPAPPGTPSRGGRCSPKSAPQSAAERGRARRPGAYGRGPTYAHHAR